MNIWGRILKLAGWNVQITAPKRDKCVICVAPHTSNWDFILGLFAYRSIGRKANFLMKKFWFFFPFKYILTYLGGIPVDRNRNSNGQAISLTEVLIKRFHLSDYLNLAVTPEGTRSARAEWKTGFLYIASGAHVPIQLGVIDYKSKKIIISEEFFPTGDVAKDLTFIKSFYSKYKSAAKYPSKFAI